jgi:hypothetical protein
MRDKFLSTRNDNGEAIASPFFYFSTIVVVIFVPLFWMLFNGSSCFSIITFGKNVSSKKLFECNIFQNKNSIVHDSCKNLIFEN